MSNTKHEIAYRLRVLRKQLSIGQEDMARQMDGISRSVLANVESGRQLPSRNLVEALCETFDVSAEWLLFGQGSMLRPEVAALNAWYERHPDIADRIVGDPDDPAPSGGASVQDHVAEIWLRFEEVRESGKLEGGGERLNSTAVDAFVEIPFYDIPVSAGAGRTALGKPPKHRIAYRRDYIHRRGLVASNLIELPIAGDSMSPELESGDTVLVDRGRTNIAGDGIYVISVDGMLYCKRLQLLPGRKLRVISINQAYEPYDVSLPDEHGQSDHIEIIGRVVRQGRDR